MKLQGVSRSAGLDEVPHMRNPGKFARNSATLGVLVWCGFFFVRTGDSPETDLIQKIILLGILVIVPLGLVLVATPNRDNSHSPFYRWAIIGQPVGAAAALLSFLFEPGLIAGSLASGWLIVNALIALFGLWRILQRGLFPVEEICLDAGLLYVPVAGVSLVISRLGIQAFGFGDTIILLTAVHFHFAGFAAPIIAGTAGRQLRIQKHPRGLFRLAAAGIIGSMPLVAIGIIFSPLLAFVGAILITVGLTLLAFLTMGWVLPSIESVPKQLLLTISSLSSAAAMCLASLYAYSIVAKTLILDIPTMAMTHGVTNAFGFAACGLVAWLAIKPRPRAPSPGMPFSKLPARNFIGPDYFERVGALSSIKAKPTGLVDDFTLFSRDDFDPSAINPTVRAFYEETFRYRLIVRPHWNAGFRFGGRVTNWLGSKVGQLRLPIEAESLESQIESRLVPVADDSDGRANVRGWVRTYEGTDHAMYVAAYATHASHDNRYMNIAFPLPGGNLSSILHLNAAKISADGLGVVLSTLPSAHQAGDQGVYYVNQLLPIRLPVDESITVWPVTSTEGIVLKAKHEMWVFGVNYLNLDYDIFPAHS